MQKVLTDLSHVRVYYDHICSCQVLECASTPNLSKLNSKSQKEGSSKPSVSILFVFILKNTSMTD